MKAEDDLFFKAKSVSLCFWVTGPTGSINDMKEDTIIAETFSMKLPSTLDAHQKRTHINFNHNLSDI